MSTNKIQYVANAVRWFDKMNGNTYHSVNVTDVSTGKTIYCPYQYGYGEHYRQTALVAMYQEHWINNTDYTADFNDRGKSGKKGIYLFERENNYPIMWNVTDGLKKDCIKNGIEN
jgi:hypothetical protein